MAYERLTGPLGQPRDDILTALLAERVTNSFGTPKGRRAPQVADFLPDWTAKPEEDDGGDDQEPGYPTDDPDQGR